MIFNIQRYSTHDGPSIHTVIFLKGCSLGCHWCQNPESHAHTQDLLYDTQLCLEGCKLCTKATPEVIEHALNGLLIHQEKLTPEHLTALTNCCPTQALTMCGEVKSIEEIMATILHNKPFYNHSSSSLTLSGGEPFMQPEMATALLQASHKAGIHTAVETCLHVPWKYITPSLPYINLFLANLKHIANTPFKQWTNSNTTRVLDNLKKLTTAGKKIIIHVPLIQGFNANKTSVKAITNFATNKLHIGKIHFLPYHTLGINKYHLLNLPYDTPEKPLDAPELLNFAQQYACQKGLTTTLQG